MTTSHWTDAHIYQMKVDELDIFLYLGHDEQGIPCYASSDRDEVVRYLEAYAAQLDHISGVSPSDPEPPPLEEPTPHAVAPCASWDKAPEWATHLAIDANGEEWWYGEKPVWHSKDNIWYLPDLSDCDATISYCGNRIDPENAALSCFERPTPVEFDEPTCTTTNMANPDLSDPPRPAGPFRDWNITIGLLHAVNCDDYDAALSEATKANSGMTPRHIDDFVLYLMEK